MRYIVTLVLLISFTLSCSYRKTKQKEEHESPFEKSNQEEWWEFLIPDEDVEVYSKRPKDQLRYAKHTAAEGDNHDINSLLTPRCV